MRTATINNNLSICPACKAPEKICGTCKHWRPDTGSSSTYEICGTQYKRIDDLCAVRPNVGHVGRLCGSDCELYEPNAETLRRIYEYFNLKL